MSSKVRQRPTPQQLDLLRALVSYSFANLLSTRRIDMTTRGSKASDKRAIAFRANEITGSINAALISEKLKDNDSFPLLVATQLHSLKDAVSASLSKDEKHQVALILDEWAQGEWEPVLSESTYIKMKPAVRCLVENLIGQRATSGPVAYSVFVEYAASLWSEQAHEATDHFEILREIRFSPEHQQAGISILSYFSVVLQQKLPSVIASVSIRQEPDKVVLVISYPDGTEEEIAQTLADYGMVVRGELPPEKFLNDPLQVVALKHKLEIAGMELRLAKELHALERATNNTQFKTLEAEVSYLRGQLASQLQTGSGVNQQLLEVLRDVSQGRSFKVIEPILTKLVDAVVTKDDTQLRAQLAEIEKADPSAMQRINDFIFSSAIGGVIGNAAYDWLKVVMPILPK